MATVDQSFAVKYNVINKTEQSFVVAYDIRNFVSQSLDVAFQLTDHLVGLPFEVPYDVRNFVEKSFDVDYVVYNGAAKKLVVAADIRKWVGEYIDVEYLIGNYISKSSVIAYEYLYPTPVLGRRLVVSYHKYAQRLGPIDIVYGYVRRVTKQGAIAYDVSDPLVNSSLKVTYAMRPTDTEVREAYPAMISYNRIYIV